MRELLPRYSRASPEQYRRAETTGAGGPTRSRIQDWSRFWHEHPSFCTTCPSKIDLPRRNTSARYPHFDTIQATAETSTHEMKPYPVKFSSTAITKKIEHLKRLLGFASYMRNITTAPPFTISKAALIFPRALQALQDVVSLNYVYHIKILRLHPANTPVRPCYP